MLQEVDADLGRPGGLTDPFDELYGSLRHQEVAPIFTVDLKGMEAMAVCSHGEVPAELEEDPAKVLSGLVRARCHEHRLKRAEARPRHRCLDSNKRLDVGELPRIVSRKHRPVDCHLEATRRPGWEPLDADICFVIRAQTLLEDDGGDEHTDVAGTGQLPGEPDVEIGCRDYFVSEPNTAQGGHRAPGRYAACEAHEPR
jgi:hypothetical protein